MKASWAPRVDGAADPRAERIVVCHASSVSGGSDAFRFAAGLTAGRSSQGIDVLGARSEENAASGG